jgi:hypothetical protein
VKQIKVTQEWVAGQDACSESVERFFERWPKGLTVNRRNLYMAAKELPIGDLRWLGCKVLHPGRFGTAAHDAGYAKCNELSRLAETDRGYAVTSVAKKHAYAKALADAIGLL